MIKHILVVASIVLVISSWPVQAQPQATPPTSLSVAGDVTKPLTLSAADVKALPRTTVTMQENGKGVVYEGVSVGELLKSAGAPIGSMLSGNALATYVKATAADGYEVVFSIGELDPALTTNEFIVADTVDGKPLFDYQGPWRIVSPHDKRGARSVRMLARLDVVRLKK